MTSKSSLCKFIKHNILSRLWCLVGITIVYFVCIPVYIVGVFGNYRQHSGEYSMGLTEVSDNSAYLAFSGGNSIQIAMILIAALILGISEFSYLNSRKKVDIFHSMPLSSNQQFFARYISGVLIYIFALLFCMGASLITLKAFMYIEGPFAVEMWKYFTVCLIYFLLVYTSVCVATIITGNLLGNISMSLWFIWGEYLFRYLFSDYKSMFFNTYPLYEYFNRPLTPLCNYLKVEMSTSGSDLFNDIFFSDKRNLWLIITKIVLAIVLACFIYGRRKTENAGKMIAYNWMELPFKFVNVLLITMLSAMIFSRVFYANRFGWMIFGGIFAFVLSNIVIEAVLRADIRMCFKHIWHWGVNALVTLLFFAVYVFDLSGFDSYIPEKKAISDIAIYFDDPNAKCYSWSYENGMEVDAENFLYNMSFLFPSGYGLENPQNTVGRMKVSDKDSAYEFLCYCVEANIFDGEPFDNSQYYYEYEEILSWEKEDYISELERLLEGNPNENNEKTITVYIECLLNDGTESARKYTVHVNEEFLQLASKVFEAPDYKEEELLMASEDADYIMTQVDSVFGFFQSDMTGFEYEKIREAYAEDLQKLSAREWLTGSYIATMDFQYMYYDINALVGYKMSGGYPIYDSFENTINALEDFGIILRWDDEIYEVESISIYSDYYGETLEEYCINYINEDENWNVDELLNAITYNVPISNISINVDIEIKNLRTGNIYTLYYLGLDYDEVPQFVFEDLMGIINDLESYEMEIDASMTAE